MELWALIGIVVGVVCGVFLTNLLWRPLNRAKSKWGINTEKMVCPSCGEPAPRVRRPRSWREFWWGGWTCAKCGCESDKWGRRIGAPPG